MNSRSGFTLVEVLVAVAVAAALVAGVYSALVSTSNTAEGQRKEAEREAMRMRALEILGQDFRGRLKMKATTGGDGTVSFTLATTSDSIGLGEPARGIREVRYAASKEGLKREEPERPGGSPVALLRESIIIEFWGEKLWRRAPPEEVSAIRLFFSDPDEMVVIR